MLKLILPLFLLITISCTRQANDQELLSLEAQAKRITIIRDDFGVPHIYAKTDADAVFGMLYAQCEDDFNRIEQNYMWAIGRLAEVEGEKALFSDLRARLYMTKAEAIAAYQQAPPWLKDLCDAFADGINWYLHSHPEVTPRLLTRFEPWMPMYFSEGSIGGDIERIRLPGIESFYGSEAPIQTLPESAGTNRAFKEPGGSNGFAIAGKLTESGNAMLLINPHTSFFFRGEIHVVSEEGLNAYGAVTWGQFFVYQGFNENTGWMHTSTGVDFMDKFAEDVFKKEGQLYYRYGEEVRPVQVSEVTLKYKEGDGLSERTFPMYHTHHGPITHMEDDRWVSTKINWDPVNALHQSFIRTKLSGHDEFREMMDIRTNSSNNTVYADSGGNIAYYHGNFVPKRDPAFDYSNTVEGSDPATDWQGLHTVDELVTVLNPENGWIQNCNSTPFTAAAKFSPKQEDYPRYMAPDRENYRGIHAVQVLSQASDLTLDKLIDLAYDAYLPGFEAVVSGLLAACEQAEDLSDDAKEAIFKLKAWDLRVSVDSVSMTLTHYYTLRLLSKSSLPGRPSMQQLEALATSSNHADLRTALEETLNTLRNDFGRWDVPWGEVNRYQRINGDIVQPFNDDAPSLPIGLASGRWGALASFGARQYPGTKKIYGTSGNSFVAVVEFGEQVKAKSMLAGGQSGDPQSPHFDDQAQRYADVAFKDVAYYREDVEKRAIWTYHPGE